MTLAAHAKWLRKAAAEIRDENHAGWGNTCEQAADAIDAHIAQHAEILQAHTPLVARLHDVTTMLEAERARIAGAVVVDNFRRYSHSHEYLEMSGTDETQVTDGNLWGKRVALVVLDKVTP
jgi:hypothetical protein